MATKKKTAPKKAAANRKTTRKNQRDKQSLPKYIISMVIITLLVSVLMYIDTGDGGIINTLVKRIFCGLFGVCGYFVPMLLVGMTAYIIKTKNIDKFWTKFGLSVLALINVSAITNLATPETSYSATDAFMSGWSSAIGGGFLGACVAMFLERMVQTLASYIILFITLIILASVISNVSIIALAVDWIKQVIADAKTGYEEAKEKRDLYEYEDEYDGDFYERKSSGNPIIDTANSLARDTVKQKSKSVITEKAKEDKKIAPQSSTDDIFSNGIEDIFSKMERDKASDAATAFAEDKTPLPETHDGDSASASKDKPQRVESLSDKEKEAINKEFDTQPEAPKIEYVAPPLSILNKPKSTSGDKRDEMRRTAEKLISVLDDFGVKAKLVQVTQGPTVTRYEIQPETGTKLSKIVGLADDIALNLAVSTVLVAPVPGKAAVGVEIPNNKVSAVSIREMLESDEFRNAKSKLTVALGKDIGGNVVVGDIAKMPHVLIAGATGSGKSVCINTIIMSLLYKSKPDEVNLIMVDPKVVELGVYNGIPHLRVPVITEPKKAAGALNWAVTEMMRRYDLFKDTGVRKLESYNKLMESTGGEKIPQLIVIIDELADLMMVAAKEVEDYICRLAQLARAAGIHLIIATQRPSVDVITGLIKANIPSRIAFAVSSQIDSRTILDKGGAEKLLGMGDMLYHPSGARTATRVQGAFVSDPEIEKVLEYIKSNSGETHYSEDLMEEIERHATGENGVTPDVEEDGDPLLKDAIELAIDLGKISTSMVQRRLGVGYSRAGRIIDQMEARGIISGANGSKPRDVLVSHADITLGSGDIDDSYEDDDYDDET